MRLAPTVALAVTALLSLSAHGQTQEKWVPRTNFPASCTLTITSAQNDIDAIGYGKITLMIKNTGTEQLKFVIGVSIPKTAGGAESNGVQGSLHGGDTYMFRTGSLPRGIKAKESTFSITSCAPWPPR